MEQVVCLRRVSSLQSWNVWAHRYFSTHSIEHVFLEQPVLFRLPQGIDVSQTSSDILIIDQGITADRRRTERFKADASVLDVVFGHQQNAASATRFQRRDAKIPQCLTAWRYRFGMCWAHLSINSATVHTTICRRFSLLSVYQNETSPFETL